MDPDDDDIVFASKGNDLFTPGKRNTFIGGDGNDTAVVEGKSSDYVLMKKREYERYTVVEAMLAQGDLEAKSL